MNRKKQEKAEESRKAIEAENAKKAEEAKKADDERKIKASEEAKKAEEEAKTSQSTSTSSEQNTPTETRTASSTAPTNVGNVEFGSDGLLVMKESSAAQHVINLLLGIPGHANGAAYHQSQGIDTAIDGLSTAEALWVLYRIEGPGFGQTAAGYAGSDTPTSHQALVDQQLNRRFDGSIHKLLKAWGTFSYSGY